jgi:hypothetical protein
VAVRIYEYTVIQLHRDNIVITVQMPNGVKANLFYALLAIEILEALAGRTLTSKPLLVLSPIEPERTKQEYSC